MLQGFIRGRLHGVLPFPNRLFDPHASGEGDVSMGFLLATGWIRPPMLNTIVMVKPLSSNSFQRHNSDPPV
jgi:hypothetical protein